MEVSPKPPASRSQRLFNSFGLLARQFLLILGKNFLLQFRRPIGTAVELIVPIVAVGVIMVARLILLSFDSTAPTNECFVTFPADPVELSEPVVGGNVTVYYAPNTTEVNGLADIMRTKLNQTSKAYSLVGVATQEEFIERIRDDTASWCIFSLVPGIYFENIEGRDIRYTIRLKPEDNSWNTESTGFSQIGPRTTPNVYFEEGFVHLQKLIDESIYEWKTNTTFPFTVSAKQLPYPSYVRDTFLTAVDFFLTLFFVLSLIYTAGVIVKELVLEKETRVKETMRMMGLSSWVLTATWYLKQMIFLFFPILVITLFLKYGRIYTISDGFLILVFLMFYVSAGIAFCFFVSVWFTSTRIGLMAGILAWFMIYFPYFFLSGIYDTLNLGTKVGVCLLPNTCVGFGTRVLADLETRGQGLTFSNFASPVSLDDQFHMGWVILMFFIDTVLYMTLYWYIDNIKPGKYGTPKPFYFLFLPSYWCGKSTVKENAVAGLITHTPQNAAAHETPPTGLEAGVSIRNLTKIYNRRNPKRRKVAVDNISLDMYKGQITALLGHNGAGKTTTMSMLTGLYTPTVGTALVDGYDINTDMDLVRRSLGICPQHNVLFDRLTVAEHLMFFALLKGVEMKKVRPEVNSMIEDLQLIDKRKTQSQLLSGGMKRKLSVGIALIGGSKIVILDEPTSGMDPYARRGTWDLLTKHKEGRTMLLTTHFMDEADLLGDRIAIMSEGQIKCSGSSLFLKSRYGVGYHLTVVKEEQCDSMAVTGLIKQNISGAELVTDVGAELSFILPSASVSQFASLFDLLDSNKKDLGVSSFGVSVTTMEEVFIKVGQGEDESLLSRLQKQSSEKEDLAPPMKQEEPRYVGLEENPTEEQSPHSPASHDMEPVVKKNVEQLETDQPDIVTGSNTLFVLWFQQFYAMLLKRLYNSIRFLMNIVWQLIIPLLFVLLSLIYAVTVAQTSTFGTEPSRTITIASSSLSDNRTFFFGRFGNLSGLSDALNFDMDDIESVGITNFVDYTNDVNKVIERYYQNSTTVQDCCNYKYQVLDSFCASQSSDTFRVSTDDYVCSGTSFGYNDCRNCTSCKGHFLRTCSAAAVAGPSFINADNFCPAPPRIVGGGSPPEMFQDYDVYVAERLLRLSGDELDTNDFFLRIQGGFVVTNSILNADLEDCNTGRGPLGLDATVIPNTPSITVWYNNQPYHMAPASINALYTLLLRKQTGVDYTITVTNDPIPLVASTQVENANNDPNGFAISTISIFGLSFLFASFILFPIEEKTSKAKHLQFVSGVQASSYWLSAFAFDMINAMIPCVVTLILFAAFYVDGYNGVNLVAIFVLLILACWAAIPLTYIFSFVFSNPLVGFAIMILFHYFLALIFQVVVLMVRVFDSNSNADIIHYIALLHPVYALGAGFSEMYSNHVTRESCLENPGVCELGGIKYVDSVFEFSTPAIGHIFLYLFLEGVFFILATIIIEREFFIPELRTMINNVSQSRITPIATDMLVDSDVVEEKERINQLNRDDIAKKAVVMNNLFKVYRIFQGCSSIYKHAVNGINLIIPKGECFGLLGVNGAGKTTTFKMLTGDITPSNGTATISGYDIRTQLRQVQQRVGYCPQFDAIIERLTGRELLTMFARLRGVPEHRISQDVENEIRRLDLTKHASKRCGTYSGGNKRKLSTAIALIGNPPIVLLDEPTTGMDPATRRFLWNALISIVKEGKSVILTSHSMEECEALCTRLAIMVNGQFKCLGSLQHLKSKYGAGFTMQMRIQPNVEPVVFERMSSTSRRSFRGSMKRQQSNPGSPPPTSPQHPSTPHDVLVLPYDTTGLKAFIVNKFPGAVLLEEHQGAVTYQIPSEGVTWSYMFSTIEQNKANFGIIDYSVSQTTLDQIFINFAKEQHYED